MMCLAKMTKAVILIPCRGQTRTSSLSFLITAAELDVLLQSLGFTKLHTKDQTQAGIQFFEELFATIAKGEAPKIGLPLLIGVSSKDKFQDLYRSLKENKLEIWSGMYSL